MKTKRAVPIFTTFGLHGVWHRCNDPEWIETLVGYGWMKRKTADNQTVVEACVMSGVPSLTYRRLEIEWPV